MLARLTFFFLLLANIVFYGWQLARTPAPQAGEGGTSPRVPELVLLREREASLRQGAAIVTGPAGEAPAEMRCFTLGPFSNQADVRRASNVLGTAVDRLRQRQTVETQDRGFWVYLPAVETREAALRAARELSAAGLRDYYVVTAGEQENTVSLGLFRQEENARRRQDALRALGFDAQITRRTEESLVYWLDYGHGPDAEPPLETILAADPGIEVAPTECFEVGAR